MTTRLLPVLLVLLLFGSVATPGIVDAAQTDVAIQSVEVSTDEPAPGETFTLSVTVANLQSSSGPVDVTDLYVRKTGSTTEYARITDTGTIATGGSLTIPLTMSIDDVGGKQLTVYAVVEDTDEEHTRVSYPLYVEVQEPDEALISAAELDLIAGEERTVNVTVANGDTAALSNVHLELTGNATIENPERVTATLPAGTDQTYPFQVTAARPGDHELQAALTYKTSDGYTRTISRTLEVTVDEARVDPELTASVAVENGSPVVRASLTEYGNVELRDVQIRVRSNGATVTRTLVPDVPAEGTQSVTLSGDDLPAGDLVVEATYTAAGVPQTTTRSLEYSPAPSSRILLTGVEATRDEDVLTLSGDAANVGSADAQSVVVSVVAADGVTPVAPKKEYFVGAVDSSEFATFEVTANVSNAVDTVPVRVEYTVDGERFESVVQVDVSDAEGVGDSAGEGDIPTALIGVGLGALLLVVVGVYLWRSR